MKHPLVHPTEHKVTLSECTVLQVRNICMTSYIVSYLVIIQKSHVRVPL